MALSSSSTKNDYVSVADVAEAWGVHLQTVYRLIAAGKLRAVRVGRIYRIAASELASFEIHGGAR